MIRQAAARVGRFLASLENPSTSLSNPAAWVLNYFGGGDCVSRDSAMRLSAVYACVSLISECVAMLPMHVYVRRGNGREIASGHPVYRLLHGEPHKQFSAFTAKQLMLVHLLLYGVAFWQILRRGGQIVALAPMPPDRVRIEAVPGGLQYHVRGGDQIERVLAQDDVLHIPGLGFDGIHSLSPISHYARDVLGLSINVQTASKSWSKAGGRPPGVIETEKGLTPEARRLMLSTFRESHGGFENLDQPLVLDGGMKWKTAAISPSDMRLLDERRFQVQEIARIYRVPLHMIGEQTKDTAWGSGLEQQTIGFTTYTISPWLERIEQEFDRKLFAGSDEFYCEHDTKALLTADSGARAEFYSKGIQSGWMTPNEARRAENLPPLSGGDQLYIPANLQPQGANP